MQVSKCLLAVCATTVCAGFLSLHAQDTPAQAAARAALLQSMGEPAATPAKPPAPANNTPILVESSGVVTSQTHAPAETNQVVMPAPAAQTPAATMQPSDSETQAAARAALLQAMGQPATETPPTAATTPPPVAAASPAVVAAPPAPMAAAPAKTGMIGQEPGFPPIVAPPPPVSAAQEQQLDALLVLYKANQISSEEYQKQRAAILAGSDAVSH